MRDDMERRPDPGPIALSLLRSLIPYGFILIAVVAFTWASRIDHTRKGRELADRESRLAREVDVLREDVRRLEHRLWAIQHDPYAVESRIRERFGLVRPGEIRVERKRSAPSVPLPSR